MFSPFACSSACFPFLILQPPDLFCQDFWFLVDEVLLLDPSDFRLSPLEFASLDSCFPVIYMSLKEDGVNTLGEVGLGGPGSVCPFWEIQVGHLGPYLAVVEFFVGFRDWSGGLGWDPGGSCM